MGRLIFKELHCSNLINREAIGKSDPYCIVKIGKVEQKTEVIDGNLNPKWKGFAKWKPFDVNMNETIELAVWDDDAFNDDFLGITTISVEKMFGGIISNQQKQHSVGQTILIESESWIRTTGLELSPRTGNKDDASRFKKKKSFGKIFISATYEEENFKPPNQSISRDLSSAYSVSTDDSISREDTEKSVRVKSVVSFSNKSPSTVGLQQKRSMHSGSSTLHITSIRGEELLARDGKSSDPYLVMTLPDDSSVNPKKTEKISKTLNPTWEIDSNSWTINLNKGILPKLDFTIWDHDVIGSDDFMGYAVAQLNNDDFRNTDDVSIELKLGPRPSNTSDQKLIKHQLNSSRKKTGSFGSLTINMRYSGSVKQLRELEVLNDNKHLVSRNALYDHSTSSLSLTVLNGIDLIPIDGKNDCDAYIEITANSDLGRSAFPTITTSKVSNCSSPVWNHNYIHEEKADHVAGVTFLVKHKKSLIGIGELPIQAGHPSRNEKCVIPLKSRSSGKEDDLVLQKHRRNNFGSLVVAYDYQVVPIGVVTPLMMQGSSAPRLPQKQRLHVLLNNITNICTDDSHSVVAVLKIGNWEDSSPEFKIDSGSKQISIKHAYQTKVEKSFLRGKLSIVSKSMFGSTSYGVAEIEFDLSDFIRDSNNYRSYQSGSSQPRSVEVALQPGDDESCLSRLNKQRNPINLGTVSLAYQLVDKDDKSVDNSLLEQAARSPPNYNSAYQNQTAYRTEDQPAYNTYDSSTKTIDSFFGNNTVPGGAPGRTFSGGYSIQFILDKAEHLSPRSEYHQCDPFIIIKRSGTEDEFKTCIVNQNTSPRWLHSIDMMNVQDDEELLISLFDSDPSGYDCFLGEAAITIPELCKTDCTYSLRKGQKDLRSRKSADGSESDNRRSWFPESTFHDSSQTPKIFYRWRIMPTDERQTLLQRVSSKPCMLDLLVHGAQDLSIASFNTSNDYNNSCLRYVRITVNDSEERKTSPEESAQWEQSFQFGVTRDVNATKLSLWEDQPYGARFLGEASVELSATSYSQGQETLQLQPRSDLHYNSDDVRLLNSRDLGLGSLNISWTFRANHQRRQFPIDPYVVIVNIIEASNVSPAPLHFVTCSVKGTNTVKYSQVERGHHPKFRTQFEFILHHDYEDIKIKLFGRRVDGAPDDSIGSISFPVGPSQSEAAVAEKTWCDLKVKGYQNNPAGVDYQQQHQHHHHHHHHQHQQHHQHQHQYQQQHQHHDHAPPRLLYMWKSVVDPSLRQKLLQQQHHQSKGTVDRSGHFLDSANQHSNSTDRETIKTLQQQVSTLSEQNRELQRTVDRILQQQSYSSDNQHQQHQHQYQYQSPYQPDTPTRGSVQRRKLTGKHRPYKNASPSPPRNSGLYSSETQTVIVEHSETRRRISLSVSLPSTVAVVVDKAKQILDLPQTSEYVIKWRGTELSKSDDVEDLLLTTNDVLIITRSDRFIAKRSPRYGRGRDGQINQPQHNNQPVLSRIQKAASSKQEHLTVALWVSSEHDGLIISTCSNSGFSGFARPHPTRPFVTEVLIQGQASDVVPLVFNIVNDCRLPLEVIEVCIRGMRRKVFIHIFSFLSTTQNR